MPAARRLIPLMLAMLAACGGSDPSGPSTGSLSLAVVGLPAGTPAAVTVTGPGGYSHLAQGSETLSGLMPGAYTVAAESVSGNGQNYQPAQSLQSVTVAEGAIAATAQITYGPQGASLALTISGLPPGTAGSVTVTGPNGYDRPVTATTTLSGLEGGVYTVAAQSVSSAGAQYDPSPGTQNVNVTSGAAASASVSYSLASAAGLNLRIDGMYLTQSVQTYDGDVPLVKDRDGFLRVFVTATQSNLAAPSVRVRFAVSGVLTKDTTLGANGLSVPLSPNEGSLSASWNMPVPGALIQPNLTILAEVDPANTVAETNESDNLFPSAGTPLPLEVRPTSTFAVRFVPILQTANGLQGDVTNANKASYLGAAMGMHPLAAYDADMRAPLSTNAPAVDATTSTAWTQILNEIKAARTSDGSSRYYYGVVKPSYSSGIAGIGYVGMPVAIGWDRPGADQVAAHEWGHNWGRQHAPCGAAANPDPNYPYANGAIGVYGFDVGARIIKPPTYSDLMGYCNNEWISDYTYTGVMDYRGTHADVENAFAQAMQPCMLVWGRIVDGQPVLEPAFQVVTRPSLPAAPGPYSVEGKAADGSSIFRVSFAPDAVADDPAAGAQFAFAVPLQPDRAERLVAMHLVERGRRIASVRASAGAAAAGRVEARRLGGGRVGLRWDASANPMLMVRDPVTGEVLSFARGGRSEIVTDRGELDLQLSTGVRGRSMRLAVPRR
jgi:CARDB protein/peptidase M66-like protein